MQMIVLLQYDPFPWTSHRRYRKVHTLTLPPVLFFLISRTYDTECYRVSYWVIKLYFTEATIGKSIYLNIISAQQGLFEVVSLHNVICQPPIANLTRSDTSATYITERNVKSWKMPHLFMKYHVWISNSVGELILISYDMIMYMHQ